MKYLAIFKTKEGKIYTREFNSNVEFDNHLYATLDHTEDTLIAFITI